ncbi:hypothetical protein STANM309S_06176 [Streptomyces tanashiensis]
MATVATTYTSATAPCDFASSVPKTPTGAIGAMNSSPYTTRSRKPRIRRSFSWSGTRVS